MPANETTPEPGHIERIDQAMYCLTTAATGMITDYSDVRVRGYLKEHTAFVAYRLDLLEYAIAVVRDRVRDEELQWRRFDVENGGPLPDADAEHHERVAEYVAHKCDCEWCYSPGGRPSSGDLLAWSEITAEREAMWAADREAMEDA